MRDLYVTSCRYAPRDTMHTISSVTVFAVKLYTHLCGNGLPLRTLIFFFSKNYTIMTHRRNILRAPFSNSPRDFRSLHYKSRGPISQVRSRSSSLLPRRRFLLQHLLRAAQKSRSVHLAARKRASYRFYSARVRLRKGKTPPLWKSKKKNNAALHRL